MAEAAVATVKPKAVAPKTVIWKWSGKTRSGEVRSGEMEAGESSAVEARLRQMGIEPTKVKKKPTEIHIALPGLGGVSTKDILVFTRQAYPLLRDAFGVDRLMWGSDWPHTQFELTQDYMTNRNFLDELIPDANDRAGVLAAPYALFRF